MELYPCSCREELQAQEGFYQRECRCVNKCVAGKNSKDNKREYDKECNEANKDILREKRAIYNERKQDKINTNRKEYRDASREKLNERRRELYEEQKDKLNTTIECECGSVIVKRTKNAHNKTLKHQQYLNSLQTMDYNISITYYLNIRNYCIVIKWLKILK